MPMVSIKGRFPDGSRINRLMKGLLCWNIVGSQINISGRPWISTWVPIYIYGYTKCQN